MGSCGVERPRGITSAEFFKQELLKDTDAILASAVVQEPPYGEWASTFYAAVQRGEEVFALVVPFRSTGAKYGINFYYKPMDETAGPAYRDAPRRVLEKLTPLSPARGDMDWAHEWRADCWANLAKAEERKKQRGRWPKVGDTICLAEPIQFTSGAKLQRFTLVQLPSTWKSPDAFGRYRISRSYLAQHEWTFFQHGEGPLA